MKLTHIKSAHYENYLTSEHKDLLPLIRVWQLFSGAFTKLQTAYISFFMPVCLSTRNNSAPTGWIFMNSDENKGYFTWRPTFIYDSILLNYFYNEKCFRQKSSRENLHTHTLFSNFFSENHGIYEIMWEKCGTIRQATYDSTARDT
jgi:hypothetical protein